MTKEIYADAIAAVKAFCKAEVAAGHCEPDQCEFCPAQKFSDMEEECAGIGYAEEGEAEEEEN